MRWPFEGLAGGVQEPPALQRAQDAERRAPTTVLMVLALDSWFLVFLGGWKGYGGN